jgi:type II secretory pathway pseudopilin PulG
MRISTLLLLVNKKISPNSFAQSTQSNSGFSLLELMVVFSLTTVLGGGGFFAFTQYSQAQEFNRGVEMLTLSYDLARNSAISNVKPESECSSSSQSTSVLEGYRVDVTEDSISLVTDCTGSEVSKSQVLPKSVKIIGYLQCTGVLYKTISGNVLNTRGSLPCTMEIYHDGNDGLSKEIIISPDGRLTIE